MFDRTEKIKPQLMRIAATKIAEADNHTALISVTNADVSVDLKQATIFISVLPADKEAAALAFCGRHASDIRDTLQKTVNWHHVPFITFKIDLGEKNRQRIDELLLKS